MCRKVTMNGDGLRYGGKNVGSNSITFKRSICGGEITRTDVILKQSAPLSTSLRLTNHTTKFNIT